ncbi:head decoration [Arthrobacter phage Persistence]|uniref:Capsid decoration protein n=1 Tax=Arthrobacter phage Persistence TaxID=2836007 RepID=A0A8F3E614_9CAUD|nr:head decoration [Arthrobacter phage Persistence]QWY79636.1 capsid decoration protein [Arthrobacter phage Persistence]
MTDISVSKTNYQVEKLSWLLDDGGWEKESITLDISTFTAGTHYPNGFIPSGTSLGQITATKLYGPYDDTATDGRQTLRGHLGISTKVPNTADTTKDAGAPLVFAAVVKESKLPATVDAAGKTDVAGWIRYV